MYRDAPVPLVVGVAVLGLCAVLLLMFVFKYGGIWFQAYMSNAPVSLFRIVGMSRRKIDPRVIIQSEIMARHAGVGDDPYFGITTRRMEEHFLAGGDVPRVIRAIIAAYRADVDLDFDKGAAIDLSGRNVLDVVRTSIKEGRTIE